MGLAITVSFVGLFSCQSKPAEEDVYLNQMTAWLIVERLALLPSLLERSAMIETLATIEPTSKWESRHVAFAVAYEIDLLANQTVESLQHREIARFKEQGLGDPPHCFELKPYSEIALGTDIDTTLLTINQPLSLEFDNSARQVSDAYSAEYRVACRIEDLAQIAWLSQRADWIVAYLPEEDRWGEYYDEDVNEEASRLIDEYSIEDNAGIIVNKLASFLQGR